MEERNYNTKHSNSTELNQVSYSVFLLLTTPLNCDQFCEISQTGNQVGEILTPFISGNS